MNNLKDNSVMKVLHVLDHSIPSYDGYSMRSQYIIENQKKIGITPIVVTSPKHKYQIQETVEEFNGITYYRTEKPKGIFSNIPFIKEALLVNCLKNRIAEIVDKENVDLIHAHSPSLCGYPASIVARKKKKPFVYEVRALWEDAAVDQQKYNKNSLKYKLGRYLETIVLKRADMITTIASHLKNEIISRGILPEKIHIVPNGVETQKFIPREKNRPLQEKYSLNGSICIGFIGSFFKFEGIEFLIMAFEKLLRKTNEIKIKLLLVGDGETYSKVIGMIKEKELEADVILTGKIPHEQVMDYYSIMDVMVYPRLRRRITELVTPLKILEAMSMEKAVICSDVGGMKEIIDNKNAGILFKAEDTDDFIEKILSVIKNRDAIVSLGKEGRLYIQKTRDWSNIIKKYDNIYRDLIAKRAHK